MRKFVTLFLGVLFAGQTFTVSAGDIPNASETKTGEIWRVETATDITELLDPENGVYGIHTYSVDQNYWDSQFFIVIADEIIEPGTPVSLQFEYRKVGEGKVQFSAYGFADPQVYVNTNGWSTLEATEEWQTYAGDFIVGHPNGKPDGPLEDDAQGIRSLGVNASIAGKNGTLLLRNIVIEVDYEEAVVTMETDADDAVISEGIVNGGGNDEDDVFEGWIASLINNLNYDESEGATFSVPDLGINLPFISQFNPPIWYEPGNEGDAFELSFEAKYTGGEDDEEEGKKGKINIIQGRQFSGFNGDIEELCEQLGIEPVENGIQVQFAVTQLTVSEATDNEVSEPTKLDQDRLIYFEPTNEWKTFTISGTIGRHGADSIDLQFEFGSVPGNYAIRNFVFKVNDEDFASYFMADDSGNGNGNGNGGGNGNGSDDDNFSYNEWFLHGSESYRSSFTIGNDGSAIINIPDETDNSWDIMFCNIFKDVEGQVEGNEFSLSFDIKWEGESNAESVPFYIFSGLSFYTDEEGNSHHVHDDYQIYSEQNTEILFGENNENFSTTMFNPHMVAVGGWTHIEWGGTIGEKGADYIGIQMNLANQDGAHNIGNFRIKNMEVQFGEDNVLSFFKSTEFDINNIVYKITNNEATIVNNTLPDGATTATIPATVTIDGHEYSVTTIGDNAFADCNNLTSIILPSTITDFGSDVFVNCDNLQYNKYDNAYYLGNTQNPYLYLIEAESNGITSCTINSGCKIICSRAFEFCRSLAAITIPNGVVSIGNNAFYYCDDLSTVDIPESVTTIGHGAFCNCHSLSSVSIPESVTSIGYSAFEDCRSLSTVDIPESVTSIGYDAFYDVKSITYSGTATGSPWGATYYNVVVDESGLIYGDAEKTQLTAYIGTGSNVVIPNTVTTIDDKVFQYCKSVTSISIPNSVVSIGNNAFSGCTNLKYNEYDGACYLGNAENPYVCLVKANSEHITSCDIKPGCKIIYNEAFYLCNDLASVTIPDGVVSIGYDAFYGCMPTITIPNSVKHIGEGAFAHCSYLTSVDVPATVETIGEDAFSLVKNINYTGAATGSPWGALNINATPDANGFIFADAEKTQLKAYVGDGGNVVIPSTVTTICDNAFYNCDSIKSIDIPSSVTSIGERAFYGCGNLKSVVIPNSVTSIGETAFAYCIGLTSATISNSVTHISAEMFFACSRMTSVTIPNSVTSIGRHAFFYCDNLESLVIPNSVTSIGEAAFQHCVSLTSLTLPNSVTDIDGYAFYSCNGLKTVTIPESVKNIGYIAFANCESLLSLDVPSSVESIGYLAFEYIKNVNYTGSATGSPWGALTINGTIDEDGFVYADAEKTRLTAYAGDKSSITIPGTVKSIGSEAFWNCYHVNSVVISNNVDSIASYAFTYCNLVSVSIPESVKVIGDGAFASEHLESVDIPASVTKIGDYAFGGVKNINYTGSATGSPWGALNVNATPDADGFIYADSEKTRLTAYVGDDDVVVIPSTVITIAEKAFEGCNITSVVIPNSVENIESSSFSNCYKLASVTMGNSVSTIGGYAFEYCTNLESIIIPNSVTSIGYQAFTGCDNLSLIVIPNSVTSIGGYVFSSCEGATFICEPDNRPDNWDKNWCNTVANTVIWGKKILSDEDFMYMVNGASKSNTATIYKYIGNGTTVLIPEKVTFDGTEYIIDGIEKDAFRNCGNLVSISIPNSILSIGDGAFFGCDNATIYCEASSLPEGWSVDWKPENAIVVLGYCINGHTEVIDAAVAATCTEAGKTEGKHCSVCKEVIVAQEVVPATGHNEVIDAAVAATCTEAGKTEGKHCSVCKEVIVAQEVVPATGHTEVIDAAVAATCTEAGKTEGKHCSVCKEVIVAQEVVPATGHTEIIDAAVAATCTEAGKTEGKHCSVCKKVIVAQEVVPATGHSEGEIVAENLKEATCTSAGSVDSVSYCTICKAEVSRKTVEISAIGHKADSIAIENVVAATYISAGSYDSVVYCSVCHAEISRTTVNVPQLVVPQIDAEVIVGQLEYTIGDNLNLDGGKIVVATSDSTTTEVVITPDMVTGFNPDSVGVQQVTIAFEIDGVPYTRAFDVTVKEPEIVVAQVVKISAMPKKTTYKKGEQLDVTDGKLTVIYSDGTTQDVDLKADMVSGFNADKVGAQKLTITLKVEDVILTANFDVSIEDDNTAVAESAANAINIYAHHNTIVVENATDEIRVYDAMGRMICRDVPWRVSTEIRVNTAGLYIVKVGNVAKRVMVNE